MTLRTLGTSDLRITPLGIGAWAFGGGNWEFGWGAQNDADSMAAIQAALESGINWIDTAAVYGLGHSESVIRTALRGLRARPYIFSKCGLVWDSAGKLSHNLQAASIRREAEASLRRLGVDTIDLYQIHWPTWRSTPGVDAPGSIEEAIGALTKLQAEGKIRHIGVSNFSVAQMRRAQSIGPIVSVQSPYSLLAMDIEYAVIPYAAQQRIGVLAYSPLASGLLSGAMSRERIASLPENDWRKHSANYREPLLSRNLRVVEILREVAERWNVTPGDVAIAWTLRNPAIAGTMVGVRNAEQARRISAAVKVQLEKGDLAEMSQGFALQVA